MTIARITSVAGCVRYWDFFQFGIKQTAKFLRYDLPMDIFRKMVFHLSRQHDTAWIGIALEDDGTPVSFAIAHECTPLFSPRREFEASLVFHQTGRSDATEALQTAFETFCRSNNISVYYATTRRDSGSTIRCFQSERYGFKRAYTTFIKELT